MHARVAKIMSITLISAALLGGCGSDAAKDDTMTDAAADTGSPTEVPVPAGMTEVEIPADFPAMIPRPEAPHVVLMATGQSDIWSMVAAFDMDADLDAEMDHFRTVMKKQGFAVESVKPMREVEGPEEGTAHRQGSVSGSDQKTVIKVVMDSPEGQQPFVTVSTYPDFTPAKR